MLKAPSPVLSQRPRTVRARLSGRLPRAYAAFALLSVILLLNVGCGAVSGTAGQQREQRRERRVTNQSPDDVKTVETGQSKMPDTNVLKNEPTALTAFYPELKKALRARKMKLETVCDTTNGNDMASRGLYFHCLGLSRIHSFLAHRTENRNAGPKPA